MLLETVSDDPLAAAVTARPGVDTRELASELLADEDDAPAAMSADLLARGARCFLAAADVDDTDLRTSPLAVEGDLLSEGFASAARCRLLDDDLRSGGRPSFAAAALSVRRASLPDDLMLPVANLLSGPTGTCCPVGLAITSPVS